MALRLRAVTEKKIKGEGVLNQLINLHHPLKNCILDTTPK